MWKMRSRPGPFLLQAGLGLIETELAQLYEEWPGSLSADRCFPSGSEATN
jgi:hypothetical protein